MSLDVTFSVFPHSFCGRDGKIGSVLVFVKDMVTQGLELSKKPHVVVATPGRLADHIRSSDTFDMKRLRFLVRKQLTHTFTQISCHKHKLFVDTHLVFSLDPGRG